MPASCLTFPEISHACLDLLLPCLPCGAAPQLAQITFLCEITIRIAALLLSTGNGISI
jgi:hypothetical protein